MSVMNDTEVDQTVGGLTHNPLEQFVLLAKTTRGAACLELIRQVLEAPGVYVFGELLALPSILGLEDTPDARYLHTLKLFAYGTYKQYLENKDQLLELTTVMRKKLQHLTIVSMAVQNKCISYGSLLDELDIKHVRDLEDLIIESIYADIIQGKLDQQKSQLEVDYTIGRDIQAEDIGKISATLQEWCNSCETVLNCIETQIDRANSQKGVILRHKEKVDSEIVGLKKTIKSQANDGDEAMANDARESSSSSTDIRKRVPKAKTPKPSDSKKPKS